MLANKRGRESTGGEAWGPGHPHPVLPQGTAAAEALPPEKGGDRPISEALRWRHLGLGKMLAFGAAAERKHIRDVAMKAGMGEGRLACRLSVHLSAPMFAGPWAAGLTSAGWEVGTSDSQGSWKWSQELGAATLQPGLGAPGRGGEWLLISPYSPCGCSSRKASWGPEHRQGLHPSPSSALSRGGSSAHPHPPRPLQWGPRHSGRSPSSLWPSFADGRLKPPPGWQKAPCQPLWALLCPHPSPARRPPSPAGPGALATSCLFLGGRPGASGPQIGVGLFPGHGGGEQGRRWVGGGLVGWSEGGPRPSLGSKGLPSLCR